MEMQELLTLQNRTIEAMGENEKTNELKKFNEQLVEKIEFEKRYPFIFSERVVRLLVRHGFGYLEPQHGKPYSSYENRHCRVEWGDNNNIDFFMKNHSSDGYHWGRVIITGEDALTEEYLIKLLKGV